MKKTNRMLLLLAAILVAACSTAFGQDWLDSPYGPSSDDTSRFMRRSDHFRMISGKQEAYIHMGEDNLQVSLQNLEHLWRKYNGAPPYGFGFYDTSLLNGKYYRHNAYILNTTGNPEEGWAFAWMEGPLGVIGMSPGAYGITDPPSWVTDHEYGHDATMFRMGNSWSWCEGMANWIRLQVIDEMDCTLTNTRSWWPLPHGVDYYGNQFFMETVREEMGTPFIKEWLDNDVYIFDQMSSQASRLTPDGRNVVKNLIGKYAAKCVNYDTFQRSFTCQNSNDIRYRYAYPVAMPGNPGWYRGDWWACPSQGGFNIIPLNITGRPSASYYTVTCNFQGVYDSSREDDWRVCFVAVNNKGNSRFSNLWNAGTNSFTLAPDENRLYLAVAATGGFYNVELDRDYPTHPGKWPHAYKIALTNAVVPEPANGTRGSGWHQHSNGQGWVQDTASVAATAYVGPNAIVQDSARVSGNTRIEDYAVVAGSAQVRDNAVVSGHSCVTDSSQIYGNAKVRDWALVNKTTLIYDNARAIERCNPNNVTVYQNACVRGNACWYGGTLSGYGIAGEDSVDASKQDHGVSHGWSWDPNQSFNDSLPDTGGLFCQYRFDDYNPSYAKDTYGAYNAYLMGSPRYQSVSDSYRGSVLHLNGVDQYVECLPRISDFRDTTIALWVKWDGGAAGQRIFSFGNGSNKYMYLTPMDSATGKLRLVVSDGTTTQSIDGTAALTPNRWTHIAVTFSGSAPTYAAANGTTPSSTRWTGTGTLYVDGAAVGATSGILVPDQVNPSDTLSSAYCNYIGRGNSGNWFAGCIDDFCVYMVNQSPSVISTLAGQYSDRNAGSAVNGTTKPSAVPLISLDAANLAPGKLSVWTNTGSIGGQFGADSTNPQVASVAGRPAVSFSGSDRMKATFTAPAGITGNGDYSVSIWAFNPSIAGEECMLSWAQRGTASRCAQFNYGNATGWGAVTHWDAADMGFDGGVPAAGKWHHICVTFSGSTEKVYVDGALNATENKTLNLWTNQPVYLGCAYNPGPSPTLYFSGSVSSVQVYDVALGDSDVQALYSLNKYPPTDTAAPTPNAPTWLESPRVLDSASVTMSANRGADPNGVWYNFTCTSGGGHDSGWISSNEYVDCSLAPGTYVYRVSMRDDLGNVTTQSAPMTVVMPVDNTAPTPNAAAFAVAPRGIDSSTITMTAAKGTDSCSLIEYKFDRVDPSTGAALASSGWQTCRTWNDTGFASNASYAYTVQMRDGYGNVGGASAQSAAACVRDDTPPSSPTMALYPVTNPWFNWPVVMTNGRLHMAANMATDPSGVQYYFHCKSIDGVEQPDPSPYDSGWLDSRVWDSPVAPRGTYVYQIKLRDKSPRLNETPYTGDEYVTVSNKNVFHPYSVADALTVPDDTLVSVMGRVTDVQSDHYTLTALDSGATICVMPQILAVGGATPWTAWQPATDASWLGKTMIAKGARWTYSSLGKTISWATIYNGPTEVHYRLNESAGFVAHDSSGNGKDAKLSTSGCSWISGKMAGSIYFSGANSSVNLPDLGIFNSFTISAWVYPYAFPASGSVASVLSTDSWTDGSLQCNLGSDRKISFQINGWGKSCTSTKTFTAGFWKHVAMVFDGGTNTARIYVDGVLDGTITLESSPEIYLNALRLGSWQGNQRFLKGKLDDVHIYSRALTAGEIANLADSTPTSISDAKKMESGEVLMMNQYVTHAPKNGHFYIEDPTRASGIRVEVGLDGQDTAFVDSYASLEGTVGVASNGEKCIFLSGSVSRGTGNGAVKAVGINTRTAKKDPVATAHLVRIAGKVTSLSPLVISDGYDSAGLKVIPENTSIDGIGVGDMVAVDGVLSQELDAQQKVVRVILARKVTGMAAH